MLYLIDKIKDEEILPHIYDESMDYMGTIVQYSIDESFSRCDFYRNLPPQLAKRLFKAVLTDVIEKYQYFFNDYKLMIYAPSRLI